MIPTRQQRQSKGQMVGRSVMQMARRAAKDFAVGGGNATEATPILHGSARQSADKPCGANGLKNSDADSNSTCKPDLQVPTHPTVECAKCHSASEQVFQLDGQFVCRGRKGQREI